MTAYLVFQRASVTREDLLDERTEEMAPWETGWLHVDTFEAHSSEQAIRKAAVSLGEQAHDTTLAAVAESSWTEHTVSIERTTRVKLGDGQ